VASSIVGVLRDYNQELPSGFVARLIGLDQEDIEPYIKELKQKKVIIQNGASIGLVIKKR
jgi:hypothetical protein